MHERRTYEVGVIGEQRAGKATERSGDDEANELITKRREADGAHSPLVGARTADDQAEAGIDQPPDQIDAGQQKREAQIVKHGFVVEVDGGKYAALVNGEAVVAAIPGKPAGDVVDHLRKRQCDHNEIDPAGAQTECADDKRVESG